MLSINLIKSIFQKRKYWRKFEKNVKKYDVICVAKLLSATTEWSLCLLGQMWTWEMSLIQVEWKHKLKRKIQGTNPTDCAKDHDLYKLVSCGRFVNDILFSTIYKTHYITLGYHELSVILCSYLNFFWVINSLIFLTKPKKPKKLGVQYFCVWRSWSLAHLL